MAPSIKELTTAACFTMQISQSVLTKQNNNDKKGAFLISFLLAKQEIFFKDVILSLTERNCCDTYCFERIIVVQQKTLNHGLLFPISKNVYLKYDMIKILYMLKRQLTFKQHSSHCCEGTFLFLLSGDITAHHTKGHV